MKIQSLDYEVECNEDKGLYLLESDSAAGKTRLYHILDEMRRRGELVAAYSYFDYEKEVPLSKISEDSVIVLIDRYDMFPGKLNDLIESFRHKALVLVDNKRSGSGIMNNADGDAEITMFK